MTGLVALPHDVLIHIFSLIEVPTTLNLLMTGQKSLQVLMMGHTAQDIVLARDWPVSQVRRRLLRLRLPCLVFQLSALRRIFISMNGSYNCSYLDSHSLALFLQKPHPFVRELHLDVVGAPRAFLSTFAVPRLSVESHAPSPAPLHRMESIFPSLTSLYIGSLEESQSLDLLDEFESLVTFPPTLQRLTLPSALLDLFIGDPQLPPSLHQLQLLNSGHTNPVSFAFWPKCLRRLCGISVHAINPSDYELHCKLIAGWIYNRYKTEIERDGLEQHRSLQKIVETFNSGQINAAALRKALCILLAPPYYDPHVIADQSLHDNLSLLCHFLYVIRICVRWKSLRAPHLPSILPSVPQTSEDLSLALGTSSSSQESKTFLYEQLSKLVNEFRDIADPLAIFDFPQQLTALSVKIEAYSSVLLSRLPKTLCWLDVQISDSDLSISDLSSLPELLHTLKLSINVPEPSSFGDKIADLLPSMLQHFETNIGLSASSFGRLPKSLLTLMCHVSSRMFDSNIANLPRNLQSLQLELAQDLPNDLTYRCVSLLPLNLTHLSCRSLSFPFASVDALPKTLKTLEIRQLFGPVVASPMPFSLQVLKTFEGDALFLDRHFLAALPPILVELCMPAYMISIYESPINWPRSLLKLEVSLEVGTIKENVNVALKNFITHLPATLDHLAFQDDCVLNTDVISSLPRQLRSLKIRLEASQDDIARGLASLPPALRRLDLTCAALEDQHLRLLPQTITHLDLIGCPSLTSESIEELPGSIQRAFFHLPVLTEIAASRLQARMREAY